MAPCRRRNVDLQLSRQSIRLLIWGSSLGPVTMPSLILKESKLTLIKEGNLVSKMMVLIIPSSRNFSWIVIFAFCLSTQTWYKKIRQIRKHRNTKPVPCMMLKIYQLILYSILIYACTKKLLTAAAEIDWRTLLHERGSRATTGMKWRPSSQLEVIIINSNSKYFFLSLKIIYSFFLNIIWWPVAVITLTGPKGQLMFFWRPYAAHYTLTGPPLTAINDDVGPPQRVINVMNRRENHETNVKISYEQIEPWRNSILIPVKLVMVVADIKCNTYHFKQYIWWNGDTRKPFGSEAALYLVVSEYLVVCYTSSLTFSISGVAKEIMTLSLAVYYYNETLSSINIMGLFVCVIGIAFHVVIKASSAPVKTNSNSSHNGLGAHIETYQKIPLLSESDQEEQELFTR
ncbi:unnamed protein product, partial [Meganyctiphanes norvegica]